MTQKSRTSFMNDPYLNFVREADSSKILQELYSKLGILLTNAASYTYIVPFCTVLLFLPVLGSRIH